MTVGTVACTCGAPQLYFLFHAKGCPVYEVRAKGAGLGESQPRWVDNRPWMWKGQSD